jgi:hypothetical protein
MRWEEGRQGSGYYKLKLMESRFFKFDMYLLKFPEGSYIETHTDPAPKDHDHHRLNIVLKRAKKGGRFVKSNNIQYGRVFKFRPDIEEHYVEDIEEGTRYVFSVGWLKRNNKLRYFIKKIVMRYTEWTEEELDQGMDDISGEISTIIRDIKETIKWKK